ncbi:MAG: hypothetical protein HDQ88_05145 [Clostridia bacterium]|nr:hypothetical protein [Clostridia bacterium]
MVKNRTNHVIFQTQYEECMPDTNEQQILLDAGYRLFYKNEEIKEPMHVKDDPS